MTTTSIKFNELSLELRLKFFKECKYNEDRIWSRLGEDAYAFFYALGNFQYCYEHGIQIEDFQFDHYNVSRSEIEELFKK